MTGVTYLAFTEAPRLDIPVDALGPGGIRGDLHVLAIMPDEKRPDAERLGDKTARRFRVSARLSKVPAASGDLKGDFTAEDGASYFVSPEQIHLHRVDTPGGRFDVAKNANREMALVTFDCTARDVGEAQATFANAVYPVLDHLAFMANVPVHIAALRVEDLNNNCTTLTYTAPYKPVSVGSFAQQFALDMQPVYALYREARNASSDFYRFLCYYKILEGLLGKMRAAVYQRAKTLNRTLVAARDRVPECDDYPDGLKDQTGKSIKHFLDSVLTPEFRNAMAHFATDDGTVLLMSDHAHQLRYANIMLITELCVRTVIANHETLLRQLA